MNCIFKFFYSKPQIEGKENYYTRRENNVKGKDGVVY